VTHTNILRRMEQRCSALPWRYPRRPQTGRWTQSCSWAGSGRTSRPLSSGRALQGVQVAVRRGWTPHEVAANLGNDISALGSVPSALASFLLNPDEPRQAVLFAVQVGGDTNTIAAMTGAIAGARCGEAGLPHSWVRRLERAGEIRDLAGSLAAMGDQR
jgi:hypothetical protein